MQIVPMLADGGLVDFDPVSALWILGIFLVLVIVLYKTAWKNVLAGLKAREERIRGDIASAEAARAKAEAALAEYNKQLATAEDKVKQILSQAAVDGEKIASGIRMRAQSEAEEIKERAIADIESSREQALAQIYEQAATLSTSIASKILRRNLNPDDQRELVNQSLAEMQSIRA